MSESNRKPLHRPGKTSPTHSRVPIHQATAGKRYRVRDKAEPGEEPVVWGTDLSYEAALKLKETVTGQRRSKTARVEEMPPEVDADVPAIDKLHNLALAAGEVREAPLTAAEILPKLGADGAAWARAFLESVGDQTLTFELMTSWFDKAIEVALSVKPTLWNAPATDPQLEAVRQRAVAAAAPVARAAEARAARATRVAPKSDPPKPPPSPLSDELLEIPDADVPEDDLLTDGDVHDLAAEVGAGPADADKQRAQAVAEMTFVELNSLAIQHYEETVKDDAANGPWPTWGELGEFEHAAWRFWCTNGGPKPPLTRSARPVRHAMGPVDGAAQ